MVQRETLAGYREVLHQEQLVEEMVTGRCGESDETRLGKILAICNFTGECRTEG